MHRWGRRGGRELGFGIHFYDLCVLCVTPGVPSGIVEPGEGSRETEAGGYVLE